MLLLIPGPVATRPEVRAALAQDFAPWDSSFHALYNGVRAALGRLAGAVAGTHAVLPLQGAGHFAIEAALRSLLPRGGRILIPITGNYAERMARLAREAGREVVELPASQEAPLSPAVVAAALAADPTISHLGQVYSETSTGVVHDIAAIGATVRAAGRRMILDAVSAFGALPLDLAAQPEIDAVVFTANKCLEAMPGMAFVIARRDAVLARAGGAESWSFDLADLLGMIDRDGGARFTPPAQVLAALRTALVLHAAEGGSAARLARYRENAAIVHGGLHEVGLTPYLPASMQGPIVVNIHAPGDPAWSLSGFVDALKARGFLISNFYNTPRPSFRIGCIGAISPDDMRRFVRSADNALTSLGVRNRAPGNMSP